MKKYFYILLMTVLLAACGNDEGDDGVDWDISAWNVTMQVSGHDLTGSHQVTAKWQGETFLLNANRVQTTESRTRATQIVFQGLYTDNEGNLIFGELSATRLYDQEPLIIDWGDGTQPDTILVSHELYWTAGLPEFNQSFMLNGAPAKMPIKLKARN